MPNYDYQCLNCGYSFEEFQKMTDELLRICPKCGGSLKRLIGAGMVPIFKGSGFYQTDYKNSNSKKESSNTGSEKKTEESKPNKESSDKKKPQ